MTDTPVLRQYREAKDRFPDALLLFRLGDFYELFFEDAVEAAPLLGVTLTSRPLGRTGRAPMCGVPQHAWERYVGKLLQAGRKVVICDQVEPPGKGLVRREVTRVLTPGTVLDDAYLEPTQPNILAAAWADGPSAGLALCDLSGGELTLCQLPAELLPGELERWRPSELLTPPGVDRYRFDPERGRERLRTRLNVHQLGSIGAEAAPLAVGAAGVVLDYLDELQVRVRPGTLRVRTYAPEAHMQLDAPSRRNLDLDGLVRLLDSTRSPMGARRLRTWLAGPLCDVEAIELRLGAVEELVMRPVQREELSSSIRSIGDVERVVARCSQRLASARELAALRVSLEVLRRVAAVGSACDALAIRKLIAQLHVPETLVADLVAALVDDIPPGRSVGTIRRGYDAELDRIHDASQDARQWIEDLEATERARTGIRSLKVGYNRVFGYYLEIPHAQAATVPAEYIRRQTLAGAERYLTPELKEREAIVLNAQQRTLERETEVLHELQDRVTTLAEELLGAARALGELDTLLAFAQTAAERDWSRPVVNTAGALVIEGGRHPVVEAALPGGAFVPNDLRLDTEEAQVAILTGPNMAGKSTFLRQSALIVLLAQCGSFVPAGAATIGIADRIFTRVGAHDDLAGGASTFMVEMTETANILNHATRSSFLILDEVGRGTSTYDGVSIAQAVVEYIHDRVGARTLFATHYHELTSVAERLPRVVNQRMEVSEEGGEVCFLHRIVPGGADRSYGIHVAGLAGLPAAVVQRARQILGELEAQRPLAPADEQLKLPLAVEDPLRVELAGLDIDRLSPLEALQKLHEMRVRMSTSA